VRGVLRPARKIGSAKIGRVELSSCDLGHGVDAAATAGGRVPALPSRQRLARSKAWLLGDCQPRHTESYAARRDRRDKLASRNSHCSAPFIACMACPACAPLSIAWISGENRRAFWLPLPASSASATDAAAASAACRRPSGSRYRISSNKWVDRGRNPLRYRNMRCWPCRSRVKLDRSIRRARSRHVRFAPIATGLIAARELTRSANNGSGQRHSITSTAMASTPGDKVIAGS